jgi:peptidoglycan/LPS O-acetylase OafA/YrhL
VLKPLTSLRFFAALLVFAYHCPLTMAAAAHYQTGDAGVEFFFVLSGFILIYVHREFFGSSLSCDRVKAFWVARFARIYPVHVLSFLFAMFIVVRSLGVTWFWSGLKNNLLALVTQVTLTQSWVSINSLVNFNIVAWSISDEMFFYALFPVLALALFTLARRAGGRGIGLLTLLLWAGTFATATLVHDRWMLYTLPPIRLIDFAVGACIGTLFTGGRQHSSPPRAFATLLELVVLAAAILAIAVMPMIPAPLRISTWLSPFSAAIIYVFARAEGAVSRLLAWSVLIYLGEISYNFYMLHSLVLVIIFAHTGTIAPALVSILSLVLCIAISTIVFERYEKPLRDRIRDALTPRAPRPVMIAREST